MRDNEMKFTFVAENFEVDSKIKETIERYSKKYLCKNVKQTPIEGDKTSIEMLFESTSKVILHD